MAKMLPQTTRALLAEDFDEDLHKVIAGLKVVERPVSALKRGQVLVKMQAATCNPSDLLLLQGKYGIKKSFPTVPGWEGVGKVIAQGGGFIGWWMMGKRVACGLQGDGEGTWAEYFVAQADACIPLKPAVPTDQAAGLIVNPMTAMGLIKTAKSEGHRGAVQGAAVGQLGRMVLAMASKMDFPIINVVRREEQVELMKSFGAEHVLNSSDVNFPEQIQALSERLGVTAIFDPIAGEATGTMLNAMPRGSTAYVYGTLSGDHCSKIDSVKLIFERKSIRGFYLSDWLHELGDFRILRNAGQVQRMMLDGTIKTQVNRRLSLDNASEGLRHYVDHMTDGKALIMMET